MHRCSAIALKQVGLGLGGVILRDVAGSGNLTSTKIYGSAAYHQMLGNTGLLSAGFNVGVSSKRVDIARFTFDNQWNGKFFDVGAPSGEIFNANNMTYFDMQIGLNYAWFPTDDIYIHAGVSAIISTSQGKHFLLLHLLTTTGLRRGILHLPMQ